MDSIQIQLLWNKLHTGEITQTHFRGRPLVLLSEEHFAIYKKYFTPGVRIGSKINYRSDHNRKHIHAIQDGDSVQIHIDHGNPYRNILLAIPHFFLDVVPYFVWHMWIRQKPYSFSLTKKS